MTDTELAMEPEVQRRLDMMARVFEWWQHASDEERITFTRIAMDQERLEQLTELKLNSIDAQTTDAQT
jgi:hypothetical protein